MMRSTHFEAGDVLLVRPVGSDAHVSAPAERGRDLIIGKWVPKGGVLVVSLDDGQIGGWDVYDVRTEGPRDLRSVYGFQIASIWRRI